GTKLGGRRAQSRLVANQRRELCLEHDASVVEAANLRGVVVGLLARLGELLVTRADLGLASLETGVPLLELAGERSLRLVELPLQSIELAGGDATGEDRQHEESRFHDPTSYAESRLHQTRRMMRRGGGPSGASLTDIRRPRRSICARLSLTSSVTAMRVVLSARARATWSCGDWHRGCFTKAQDGHPRSATRGMH